MSRDLRIDAYIAKAQPFARPILDKVRERVHAVVPDVEDGADARVAERTGRTSLDAESLEGGLVAGRFRRQELEGDLATQPPVLGEIDHAHAAGAQGLQDPVV